MVRDLMSDRSVDYTASCHSDNDASNGSGDHGPSLGDWRAYRRLLEILVRPA